MQRLLFTAAALIWTFGAVAGASAQLVRLPWPPQPLPIVIGAPAPSAPIAPSVRTPLSADASALVAGNNHFALDMYHSLSAGVKPDSNLLVSPFSISAALAMTYAGARGETAQQMAGVLGFTLPDDRLHTAFGELLCDLTTPREGYQLNIANRLFGQAGYPFKTPFVNTTGQNYGAPLEATDFVHDPDGSRSRINSWVAGQTQDKIRDLMPDGSVTSDTRLVLTNAMYFHGSWKYKFDSDATHNGTFFSAGGAASQVSMMTQLHKFEYADQPGYQMLEMPYAGDDLSMVVLLPKERDGLADLENSLTADGLQAGLDSLRQQSVFVSVPKFKFDSSFDLGAGLKDMGITDAFDPDRADLSGIVDPSVEQLRISTAVHKAFIDVNEEGTEAAAATAVGIIAVTSVINMEPPKDFIADHSFLFALRDMHSGSLLFLGRVVAPGATSLTSTAETPEPSTLMLMAIAVAAIWGNRSRVA
jgi:serpin B